MSRHNMSSTIATKLAWCPPETSAEIDTDAHAWRTLVRSIAFTVIDFVNNDSGNNNPFVNLLLLILRIVSMEWQQYINNKNEENSEIFLVLLAPQMEVSYWLWQRRRSGTAWAV